MEYLQGSSLLWWSRPMGELTVGGERDDKVISIPVDPRLRPFHVDDLRDQFPGVLELLEEWSTYYDATEPARALGGEDKAAVEYWQVK
jgi:hypothetical protein